MNIKRYTLIELLVTLAIIATLTSLLFTVMAKAVEEQKRIHCADNLRQIGVATAQYVGDNNGFYYSVRMNKSDGKIYDIKQYSWWSPGGHLEPYLPARSLEYKGEYWGQGDGNEAFNCPSNTTPSKSVWRGNPNEVEGGYGLIASYNPGTHSEGGWFSINQSGRKKNISNDGNWAMIGDVQVSLVDESNYIHALLSPWGWRNYGITSNSHIVGARHSKGGNYLMSDYSVNYWKLDELRDVSADSIFMKNFWFEGK